MSSERVSPDDPRSQTSRLQNCKATNFSSLNGPVDSTLLWPSWQDNTGSNCHKEVINVNKTIHKIPTNYSANCFSIYWY